MNAAEHYAEAERLLSEAVVEDGWTSTIDAGKVSLAHVHALLALARPEGVPSWTIHGGHRVDTETLSTGAGSPLAVVAMCSCGNWYERVSNPTDGITEDELVTAMNEKIRAHVEGG